jgi:hypothetical protein
VLEKDLDAVLEEITKEVLGFNTFFHRMAE